MPKKQRILPKWSDYASLHDGWSFAGDYRVEDTVRAWVPEAEWPDTLPVRIEVQAAERGRLQVQLQIDAQARLPCQRCGAPLDWAEPLQQELLLVREEQKDLEQIQWPLDEDKVYWQSMVEGELSLGLPDYPRHPQCDLQGSTSTH